jgi:threonine dehydratase
MTSGGLPKLGTEDLRDAGKWLAGQIAPTPVIRSETLDQLAGAQIWLKAENVQTGGSFKLRGALLAVRRLREEGVQGVVAQSTGNHAISVAIAAHRNGIPAVLVLPQDAAPGKIRRIKNTGAEVVLAGSKLSERTAVVNELSTTRGYAIVDPYQNPDVVVGQGTATMELLDQVQAAGGRLNKIVIPVGGGSAVAGACLAARDLGVSVIAAEPAAVPALSEALRAGHPVTVEARPTIADGLRPDTIGQLPFDLCHQAIASVVTVSEEQIGAATCLTLMHAKLLVEPAAATALAAALQLSVENSQKSDSVGVLLTGGNIEPELVASLVTRYGDSVLRN